MPRFAPIALLCLLAPATATAQTECIPTGGDPSVTICSPTEGQDVNSPIHIRAVTTDSVPVDLLQVYYNGHKKWEKNVSEADIFLRTGAGGLGGSGAYRVTVQAHDTSGRWFNSTVNVNVGGGSFGCTAAELEGMGPRTARFCSPIDGEIARSPILLVTWAEPISTIKVSQVYVDGMKVYEKNTGGLHTLLPMALGRHRVTVQAYDDQGPFQNTIHIRVNEILRGCEPAPAQPSVSICSPTDGGTAQSPVTVKAAATAATGIQLMQIYLDRVKVYQVERAFIDTALEMSPGEHRLTVQARDNKGNWFNQTIMVSVE
jgi:hypothetical protein